MAKRGPVKPIDELETLAHRSVEPFTEALNNVAKAEYRFQVGTGSQEQRDHATHALGLLMGHTLTLADLMGRRRLLLNADREGGGAIDLALPPLLFSGTTYAKTGSEAGPIDPKISYVEAIKSMVEREPRLSTSYKDVQAAYMDQYSFSLAKSSSLEITKKVQKVLSDAVKTKKVMRDPKRAIKEIGNWTSSYAETVYRTNLNTAYSDGIFEQAKNPVLRGVVGGFRYTAIGDRVTRPNHAAAEGLTAPIDHPVWDTFKPPLGYNCRCALRSVTAKMMERDNLRIKGHFVAGVDGVPFVNNNTLYRFLGARGASPDKGFNTRSGGPGVKRPYQ